MKIRNATSYSTRDLRRFLYAGFAAFGVSAKHKVIDISYSKRRLTGHHDGRAHLGGLLPARWMVLGLPRDPTKLNVGHLGKVLRHEHAHQLGIRHREMDADLLYCTGPDPAWTEGLTIGFRRQKKMTPADRVANRAERATRNLVIWRRRLKIAEGRIKHWTAKVRYYERRAAAGPTPTPDRG